MQYSILGKTGLKVSRLGFGAMRLPMRGEKVDRDLAVPMIRRAFEGGVNFIDSAVGYCGGDSQRVVGEALKGWRGYMACGAMPGRTIRKSKRRPTHARSAGNASRNVRRKSRFRPN